MNPWRFLFGGNTMKRDLALAAIRDLADQFEGTTGNRVNELMQQALGELEPLPDGEREARLEDLALTIGTVVRGVEAVYTAAISK